MDFLGPDGKPVIFEGDGYYSQDHTFKWAAGMWVPVKPPRRMPGWLTIALWIGFGGIFAYAVYASALTLSPTQVYDTGFFFGVVALLVVLALAFRYAGRFGSGGTIVRGLAIGLFVLRLVLLFARPH